MSVRLTGALFPNADNRRLDRLNQQQNLDKHAVLDDALETCGQEIDQICSSSSFDALLEPGLRVEVARASL